ncbi:MULTISPECIES: hypothetical protein [Streptomyces]|uniref:hypothetical protein n=1 Tax=Streptomyces TaxID=1883 RepID=UPI001902F91C|nr:MULTISPECIES: hypothetical protein [unclassified Streptomyces]MCU4745750.1 hypothetical protein [Streptomyces sp. G-5]QQN79284.1 hypothetical protein IPZ77_18980 [Streptomyces sp. XC 2026]
MLRKLTSDSDCKQGNRPNLWATESGDAYVVQGYVITDPRKHAVPFADYRKKLPQV